MGEKERLDEVLVKIKEDHRRYKEKIKKTPSSFFSGYVHGLEYSINTIESLISSNDKYREHGL